MARIHPAGEEIPASKLPDQTVRKLYRQDRGDFPPTRAFHSETGSPALFVRHASSQADRDSGSKLGANDVISDRLLR